MKRLEVLAARLPASPWPPHCVDRGEQGQEPDTDHLPPGLFGCIPASQIENRKQSVGRAARLAREVGGTVPKSQAQGTREPTKEVAWSVP